MDTLSPSTRDKLSNLTSDTHTATWKRVKTALRIISLVFASGAFVESLILLRGSTQLVLPILPITSVGIPMLCKLTWFVVTKELRDSRFLASYGTVQCSF